MGRKPSRKAITYRLSVKETADVPSNPALSKTSGITFEVAPPSIGPPPSSPPVTDILVKEDDVSVLQTDGGDPLTT